MGYPSRVSFDTVYESQLCEQLRARGLSEHVSRRNLCEAVLVAFGLGGTYQLGLSKVFFRSGKQELLQEVLKRTSTAASLTPEVERKVRQWIVKRRIDRFRGATVGARCGVHARPTERGARSVCLSTSRSASSGSAHAPTSASPRAWASSSPTRSWRP